MREREFVGRISQFACSVLSHRKSLMSVIFPPVILGPGMAAPILWALAFLVLSAGKPPMPIKFLVLGGVVAFLHGGGGLKCQFYFYERGDFSDLRLFVRN